MFFIFFTDFYRGVIIVRHLRHTALSSVCAVAIDFLTARRACNCFKKNCTVADLVAAQHLLLARSIVALRQCGAAVQALQAPPRRVKSIDDGGASG